MSRFLLLMAEAGHFDAWDAADDALRDRVVADFQAFDRAVRERGAVVGGEALSRPETARTVRPAGADDVRPVTAGPFAETVEQLGGFYLVDVPDLAAAVELATLLPREYAVEVRECVDVPDF
ncbi:transcription initiation protein [Nocardioides dongxiaopingii]|uniref:YciI family protein n=1 Tax=Nocardioides sp. S-1144 TaxID=2582905 RepID=UPI00110EC8C5|nr:YciI family protein [Nocardioides sp. S-1144]QCW52620.1 transcription initiation protein [Nocardioides sp. S-1144]